MKWPLPQNRKVVILGGGPGLGFYVPGLVLKHQLSQMGFTTDFHVYETFLKTEKRERLPEVMAKFHQNFKAALISQKLAKRVDDEFDEELLTVLFRQWKANANLYFISFSGHWVPILERYSQYLRHTDFTALLCHIDVVNSTSWSLYQSTLPVFQHVWFTSWADKKVHYFINLDSEDIVPMEKRSQRFMIHGGGWGMGTYLEKIDELNLAGIPLDILLYQESDRQYVKPGVNRFYMVDPDYEYWKKYAGEHAFPPLQQQHQEGKIETVKSKPSYPAVYNLLKQNKAIISKPGAGTLLDSMSSATPLVILEPFGTYEKLNGELWQELGFGITLQAWQATKCSMHVLDELHTNLCRYRKNVVNFLSNYYEN